jgi:trigger factor
MQATLEETGKHTVRLNIEVPAEEFSRDLAKTYRKVAGEVRVPGFRKGKVPRQIIDARIGRDHILHEFVDDFVPTYYLQAIREHQLAPIAEPEIDLDPERLEEGHPLRFTATVEIRPRLELEPEHYRGIHVDAPATEPREVEIDEFIDQLRERFAELEVVSRPARKGDYVLADVRAHVHDREIPEATRLGFLSEVGSDELVPELDKELEGKRKGDILKFNAVLPQKFGDAAGQEVTFQVLVKEVKAKKLPAADDEFAKVASEFDSLDELREDVRTKLRTVKEREAKGAIRDLVLQRLVDHVEVELPERMVDEETERRVRRAEERATQAGTTLDDVLKAQGWDQLRFRSDARSHATRALKSDLVLEAVARREDITSTADEIEADVKDIAQAWDRDVKEVRRVLQRTGQVAELAGDIIRGKALDLLVQAADVTGEGSWATQAEQPEEATSEEAPSEEAASDGTAREAPSQQIEEEK